MNIDRIVDWRPGHETAPKIAFFAYIPCSDTIRTGKLVWSQNCRNDKIDLRSGSNPAKNP